MKKSDNKNIFAVMELGGSQHIVSVGDVIEVNRVEGKKGEEIVVDKVYLIQNDEKTEIGTPVVNYVVKGEIVAHYKGEKVEVFKYKAKSRYRKSYGHRQDMSRIKVTAIESKKAAKSAVKSEAKPEAKKAAPKKKAAKTAK